MQVIVHGGAGEQPKTPDQRQTVLNTAAESGAAEATPIEAVETALRSLESDPQFNAGRGACLQSDGIARTDAGIMTGDRSVGAVCGMPGVEAAVSVARHVLEETPHVMITGVHAVDLAASAGIDVEQELSTPETQQRYEDVDMPAGMTEQLAWVMDHYGGTNVAPAQTNRKDHDTVGAVAVSEDGTLAAATSTGGRWLALRGRVGDVPQVGAGYYASPAGAASTTGAGEDIARMTLARQAVRRIEDGADATTAANKAIEAFDATTGAPAGVIVADGTGTVGAATCAPAMQTATAQR